MTWKSLNDTAHKYRYIFQNISMHTISTQFQHFIISKIMFNILIACENIKDERSIVTQISENIKKKNIQKLLFHTPPQVSICIV